MGGPTQPPTLTGICDPKGGSFESPPLEGARIGIR